MKYTDILKSNIDGMLKNPSSKKYNLVRTGKKIALPAKLAILIASISSSILISSVPVEASTYGDSNTTIETQTDRVDDVINKLKKMTGVSNNTETMDEEDKRVEALIEQLKAASAISTDAADKAINNEVANNNAAPTTSTIAATDGTKVYNCPCPAEEQKYIYEMSIKYGVSFNALMAIIDNESGGTFAANGIISASNDYGYCQINVCNHATIYNNLGFSSSDLLNDRYKNIEACAYLVNGIYKQYPNDPANGKFDNIFGAYNGWLNWRNIKGSVNYSNKAVKKISTMYNLSNEELAKIYGNMCMGGYSNGL